MDVLLRIKNAEEELRLAREELERQKKTGVSEEAKGIYKELHYNNREITVDDAYDGKSHVEILYYANWTGSVGAFKRILEKYGMFVGNYRVVDNNKVKLSFFKL